MKIPHTAIPDCYKYSKQAFEGKITDDEARQKIHSELGINFGSAKDYPKLFKVLMTGEGTLWNLNSYTQNYFLETIYQDYGKDQLQKSLSVFMRLIKKYEGNKIGSKKSMRFIYDHYNSLITSNQI